MALFPSGADWTEPRKSARHDSSSHEDMHAGEIETFVLLHAHPELVRARPVPRPAAFVIFRNSRRTLAASGGVPMAEANTSP